jgi:hypothetical protein
LPAAAAHPVRPAPRRLADLRRVYYSELVKQAELTESAVLDATSGVSSNYDRAEILLNVADRGGLTPATSNAFMGLVRTMASSHDQRRVLSAVTAQGNLPEAVAVEALKSTSAISGSYDKTETLIRLMDRGGLSDGAADTFFQSAAEVTSSYDLSRILKRVTEQPMTQKVLEGVLRTSARISGAHDRANLLEAVASKMKIEGQARELYISATRGLGSYDENRALAALVRAEVRR